MRLCQRPGTEIKSFRDAGLPSVRCQTAVCHSVGCFHFKQLGSGWEWPSRTGPERDGLYLLALWTAPCSGSLSGAKSRSMQQDHIIPPEQRSSGLPPPSTQDRERPHSNLRPLCRHVWGITERRVKCKMVLIN